MSSYRCLLLFQNILTDRIISAKMFVLSLSHKHMTKKHSPTGRYWLIGVIALLVLLVFLLVQMPVAWLLGMQAEQGRFRLLSATGNLISGTGVWEFRSQNNENQTRFLRGQVQWQLSLSGLLTTKPYTVTVSQGDSQLSGQASFDGRLVRLYQWSGKITPDSLKAAVGLSVDQPVVVHELSGVMAATPELTGRATLDAAQITYHVAGLTGGVKMPALTAQMSVMPEAQGTQIQVSSPAGTVAQIAWGANQIHIGITYRLIKEMTGVSIPITDDDTVVMEMVR